METNIEEKAVVSAYGAMDGTNHSSNIKYFILAPVIEYLQDGSRRVSHKKDSIGRPNPNYKYNSNFGDITDTVFEFENKFGNNLPNRDMLDMALAYIKLNKDQAMEDDFVAYHVANRVAGLLTRVATTYGNGKYEEMRDLVAKINDNHAELADPMLSKVTSYII